MSNIFYNIKEETKMEERNLKYNDIVRHFKRESVDNKTSMYLYRIINIGIHSETKEKMMIYQGLYGDFSYYVRPLDMFLSKVDKEKYPNIKQEYRFEKTNLTDDEKEIIKKEYTKINHD